MRTYTSYAIGAAVLLIGAVIGWSLRMAYAPVLAAPVEYRVNTTPQYSLINPLIFIDTDERFFTEYDALRNIINAGISTAIASGTANSVSAYYRDMNNGHWMGINDGETY